MTRLRLDERQLHVCRLADRPQLPVALIRPHVLIQRAFELDWAIVLLEREAQRRRGDATIDVLARCAQRQRKVQLKLIHVL